MLLVCSLVKYVIPLTVIDLTEKHLTTLCFLFSILLELH